MSLACLKPEPRPVVTRKGGVPPLAQGDRVSSLAQELGAALGVYSKDVAPDLTAGKSLEQVRNGGQGVKPDSSHASRWTAVGEQI